MRTLSARILLGFAVLTITFGVITSNMVWNLSQIEDQANLILRGYVPLALAAGDLARRQEDIKNYLDQGLPDAATTTDVGRWVATLRTARDKSLADMVQPMEVVQELADTRAYAATEDTVKLTQKIDQLRKDVEDELPMFATVVANPPLHVPSRSDAGFSAAYAALDPAHQHAYDALEQLRDSEKKISRQVNELAVTLKRRTTRTKDWLADNERILRNRAIYLGLTAVLLGMLVTTWVVITLRPLRRLRDGARRIAAGDYASRILETGPTEVADLAREFNSMGQKVKEREAEKEREAQLNTIGTMAQRIAHEVGNPLTSIGLNTELLLDHLEDNAEARAVCNEILKEVHRLSELTEDYLGMRSAKPRLARESLNAIVDDLVGFVRKDLAKKGVIVETELAPDDPIGNVDASRIRQCLINIVRNAADAVAAAGGGHVRLRTHKTADRAVIDVVDDGVGIPSDLLPKLFAPSFSTKDNGSGIGLALSQQIVREHGGDIAVTSAVGRGSTFSIRLPAA